MRLLIIGGSLGAQALNNIVPKMLQLIPEDLRPLVVHQAGENYLDSLKENYAEAGVEGNLRHLSKIWRLVTPLVI